MDGLDGLDGLDKPVENNSLIYMDKPVKNNGLIQNPSYDVAFT